MASFIAIAVPGWMKGFIMINFIESLTDAAAAISYGKSFRKRTCIRIT